MRRLRKLDKPRVRVGSFRLFDWLSRRLADDDATLSVIAIDRLVLFGVPCDLAASLGGRLKAAARQADLDPLIAGFADDYIGYCLPAETYNSGSYEASKAFNGPDTGEQITDELVGMLDEMGLR